MTPAQFFKLLLCLALPAAAIAGGNGGRAEYVGGTVAALRAKCSGSLYTTNDESLEFRTKQKKIQISFERINLLEYGQKASRRYAMAVLVSPVLLLSKKRAHFLTIGFTDPEGRQQAMVFRVDKDDIRTVLVSLEARTGRKVVYQDDEARKAGKG